MTASHLNHERMAVDPAGPTKDAEGPVSIDMLYTRFSGRVANIGFRIMGRSNDIEDYVQEVFIEAHRSLHSLAAPAAAKYWLDRIAVRTAVRQVRSNKWRRWLGREDAAELDLADTKATPEIQALLRQTLRRLERLPGRARACWMLRKVEGYALAEVAEIVGCSLATAKRDIARVDLHLKQEKIR